MAADHRLGPLKKSDLQYEYPESATEGDDPSKRGTPDKDLLNRSEWYEMLYFCNRFANENLNGKKDVALRVERLIKGDFVPADMHSQERIERFIIDNWLAGPD
ncbi:hypothetical protein [Janthinobacterium rivuli]|uniref:hypothetical protein n=1 Tax=Janthinobacterium rivuli TaxID=2751478 RepID=UPI00383A8BD8